MMRLDGSNSLGFESSNLLRIKPQKEMRPARFCKRAGRDFRVGSIFQGWLGTDLRIVTYGRSRASRWCVFDGRDKVSGPKNNLSCRTRSSKNPAPRSKALPVSN